MTSNLVIFDCDGVLVDSEPISNRLFREMLGEIGVDVSPEYMFEHFVGRSMPQCMEHVAQLLGRPAPDDFLARLQRRTEDELRAHVQPMPGIARVLDALRLPCCVASSGGHSKIRTTLGATGLLDRFRGRIFSADDVARSKPAPDLFLHAAAALGCAPARCLVIEDTPPGVRAGVAAGMQVYGFCAHTSAQRLREAGAHATFQAMSELPPMIERWAGAA
jgi:HAD superfamily hydrolase (TIGR01509 family)